MERPPKNGHSDKVGESSIRKKRNPNTPPRKAPRPGPSPSRLKKSKARASQPSQPHPGQNAPHRAKAEHVPKRSRIRKGIEPL